LKNCEPLDANAPGGFAFGGIDVLERVAALAAMLACWVGVVAVLVMLVSWALAPDEGRQDDNG